MNSTRVGWVSEPDGRGTAGLLYSCLFTIFLSTWTAYHPDVESNRSEAFWAKVGMTVMFIFAPEGIVWMAMDDWRNAKRLQYEYTNLAVGEVNQPTTKEGIADTERPLLDQPSRDAEKAEIGSSCLTALSMTRAYFLWMQGFVVRSSDGKTHQPRQESTYFTTIAYFKAAGVSLASVSVEEIEDKSKSDSISRLIACIQISWLFIQLVGRAAQRIPISTLELFTASNAACAVVSYVIWWNKPKDVGRPIILQSPFSHQAIQDRKKAYDCPLAMRYPRRVHYTYRIVAILAILLASLSLFGWSFPFVTYAEQLTWRILSILLPVLALTFMLGVENEDDVRDRGRAKFFDAVIYFITTFYVTIRLYFIVEVFTGLRSSPLGLYSTVNWSKYFPHW